MPQLGQTVTVINKSGKVVSTSRHLVSVFKEAKAVYQARKAEIRATRDAGLEEKRARRALKHASLSDEHLPRYPAESSRVSSSHGVRRSKSVRPRSKAHSSHHRDEPRGRHEPPPSRDFHPKLLERGFTDSALTNDCIYAHPSKVPSQAAPTAALVRRSTEPPQSRSRAASFDEHLAYGNLPPPLPVRRTETEVELRGQMTKLTQLLDEANCLQFTATTMIDRLQQNPEALAAVALTLAEASALATKMGPSALGGLKAAFPAAMALLMSPQFLIAAGVGVGVTVVMLGGYKIVKRIRKEKSLHGKPEDEDVVELQEIQSDLSGIELWRRGIADVEAHSVGTSVDGEFITPNAASQLVSQGLLSPSQLRPARSEKSSRSKSHKSHKSRRAESVRSEQTNGSRRSEGQRSSRRRSADDVASRGSSKKEGKRKKAVSGLKMLFQGKPLSAP